jgi:hypothetical protein
MDISVEIINVLKNIVDLHVLIEITPGSKNENIIDVDVLPQEEVFVSPDKLLKAEDYQYLKPYFDGVSSINFIVHSRKSLATSLDVRALLFTNAI